MTISKIKTTFTLTMEEEDIEFIAIALQEVNRLHEDSKTNLKYVDNVDEWVELCQSCIEKNNRIIEQLEFVVGHKY